MADATLLPSASPKDLGKQLRAVRRRKGLSLSEVARGAGLSRRELVAYERGKVEIPESDLWVIAGSCGVDVAELVPPTEPAALAAAPTSIEDSISQLRSNQVGTNGLQRHLDTLYALRALPPGSVVHLQEPDRLAIADALGRDPASIETRLVETMRVTREEARRLRALVVPDTPRYSPLALEPAAAPTPPTLAPVPATAPEPAPAPTFQNGAVVADAVPGPFFATDMPTGAVDVFEELAKLPEPVALTEAGPNDHDLFAPPPEPVSVQASPEASTAGAEFSSWPSMRSALPEPSAPVVVERVEPAEPLAAASTSVFGAEHAPPIDVVGRIDSSAPRPQTDTGGPGHPGHFGDWTPPAPDEHGAGVGEAGGWDASEPRTPSWDGWSAVPESPPGNIVEFVDDFVVEHPGVATEPDRTDDATSWSSWARTAFVDAGVAATDEGSPASEPAVDAAPFFADLPAWLTEAPTADTDASAAEAGFADTSTADPTADPTADATADAVGGDAPWEHQPDPEASSTGFYVDWGSAPSNDEASAVADAAHDSSIDADPDPWTPPDEPAPISWRPLADTVAAAVAAELAATGGAPALEWDAPEPEQMPATEPEPIEEFVTAGSDWVLGNAVPLVEVRGEGGLVMRRADERWALADIVASPSFALEVDVDFRSGPGFGVLFHAGVDDDGHMSGYSFDVDPIHEGGSYLVRQWHADRELWNPLARVPASDPADMHGVITLRVVVDDDTMTAAVNGAVVLTVDNLKQACADRNREPEVGDRIGIQAWSSSDLVIETLRVAER